MLTGLLLKESLQDENDLDLVRVTKTEVWDVTNAAPSQPEVWTALIFEAEEQRADEIAAAFSHALKPEGWYLNFSFDDQLYVIFPRKVFKYLRGNQRVHQQAIRFGRALNIPESQLDWGE